MSAGNSLQKPAAAHSTKPPRQMTPFSIPFETRDILLIQQSLNHQFFGGRLGQIPIQWSCRMTSSLGVFVVQRSRSGKCLAVTMIPDTASESIRLSIPLFRQLSADTALALETLRQTLAHEMIHQWQHEILSQRPDHGPAFRAQMAAMRQSGLNVTVYHGHGAYVNALARYCWTCQRCATEYRRQRRTINPRRHRCGRCHGLLRRVDTEARPSPHPDLKPTPSAPHQLTLGL